MGAEKLLGNGDMLFLLPGTASPLRLHNAYVTLDEIQAIMKHIEDQPKPEEITLPEVRIRSANSSITTITNGIGSKSGFSFLRS